MSEVQLKVGDWVIRKTPYRFMDGTEHPDLHTKPRQLSDRSIFDSFNFDGTMLYVNFEYNGKPDCFSFNKNRGLNGYWSKWGISLTKEVVKVSLP